MKASEFEDILKGKNNLLSVEGNKEISVYSLHIDSRKVKDDGCYFAVKGTQVDGHDYIKNAIEKGATCIICEEMPSVINDQLMYFHVKDCRKAIATVAHHFYDYPSTKLSVVGVTGTNGKTSIATLLFQLYSNLGSKCGLISTVENRIGEVILPSTHTTPDAIAVAQLMARMYEEECEYIFMEVSSHALEQSRVNCVKYKVAIFSNLSHDHLDYHGTMLHYINAKKLLFDQLDSTAAAIVNADDRNGQVMVQNCKAKVITYALHTMADYHTRLISDDINGLHLRLDDEEVIFSMSGAFNAYNLTAVYIAARELGLDKVTILQVLSILTGAEGRMEKVIDSSTKKIGIVDYAHTPDALENVLKTLRSSLKLGQHIITVVGCGGDRDRTKRPVMAKIAAEFSDKVVFTSDNPRSENPELILDEMFSGIPSEVKGSCLRITDRQSAIKTAVLLASPGDVILVAGKGHEKYQEINGVKTPFEDKEVLLDVFQGKT